ncbi:MAG: YeeE/YedE family protein [Candidatus Thiodiazotropha sp. (ex Codakia rugifera)]|nr:YeeE/YedE family protein [Candidatus Thiodiazotropha sp. (ex Codakia rugifera)]
MLSEIKDLWPRQWPFWLGGLFVGLSEIVYYFRYDSFIVVTTGFAQMFAVSEEYLFGIDWVGRLYEPGIHWVIIGAVLGARLVATAERESRAWVRYHWKMLLISFIGGLLFSFGTRIAGGCTTHHFIGGLPSMSIASWVVLLSGIPFAFLAFLLAMKVGMGGYFRHQDTLEVAKRFKSNPEQPQPGLHAGYRPLGDPIRLLLSLFLLVFLAMPVVFALFTDEISGGISDIGWVEVGWLMAVGLLLGFGIAKCGFGTECSVMAPEAVFTKPEFYLRGGVPKSTYHMFRGMLPLQGFMVAIVMFNLFIVASWLMGVGDIPNASGEAGLYWGHILGGPLLAVGAVFMIGCEVRTYARLGLGYATALAALPGFYIGYLPYTFFSEQIDPVIFSDGLTDFITIPEWAAFYFGGDEVLWIIGYSLFLIAILLFSFGYGRRFLHVSMMDLLRKNTDELVYTELGRKIAS